MRSSMSILVCIVAVALLLSCSSTKYVPDGQYLLNSVKIRIDGDNSSLSESELQGYLRQTPNHKVLGFAKLQLSTYSLSGRDSSKWYNKWLRRLGQAPVIYDSTLMEMSKMQLRQTLINHGYLDAEVIAETKSREGSKKMDVVYTVNTGKPHVVENLSLDVPDSAIRALLLADTTIFKVNVGDNLNRMILDEERVSIVRRLNDNGYYDFTQEYITFTADTMAGSKAVGLTLHIANPRSDNQHTTIATSDLPLQHELYSIRKVVFVTDYDPAIMTRDYFGVQDTVRYRDISVLYAPGNRYLRPSALYEKCFLTPGTLYSQSNVQRTYEALQQLGILSYIHISLIPAGEKDGRMWLDVCVLLTKTKNQSIAVEVEGTNSEGDLGFGVGLTYQHRNLARGSELLTTKFRTSYESLSGNLNGLINNRYTEQAGEVSLTFPKFKAPFVSQSFKRRIIANTEFSLSGNYQERPEYTRIIAGAAWKYKFSRRSRHHSMRHTFDLIDLNYVYLPKSTLNFLDSIAPSNPLLRYSYENHLIMRMGYTFHSTNRKVMPMGAVNNFAIQPYITTFRVSVETAGNLLNGLSHLFKAKKHDGAYRLFGTQYAQYVKGEVDYTYTRNINTRNSVSIHAGGGIAVPYGNSSMVPFEKRFYAGGANGVRGWSVRSLGPGSYESRNSVVNFINQCGDIRLDLSFEYRAKLFWVLEGALFIDAGNIWTIRDYENQPGGLFRFNSFYKQIALAYGTGLRMDFTYFLLRFDLGFKAHNPARGEEAWPLLHPRWHRDATFHFAVGYPF